MKDKEFIIRLKSQDSATIREMEDLRSRLRKEVDAIFKAYGDMIQYEKRFTPDAGADLADQNSINYIKDVNGAIAGIMKQIEEYAAVQSAEFKKRFGIGMEKAVPSEEVK